MIDLNQYTIDSADMSLAIATRKTALQVVTGSTRLAQFMEVKVSLPSATASDVPVLVEVREQSTAGTSSAYTPLPTIPSLFPAAIATARNAFTVEPTDVGLVGDVPVRVTAVGGLLIYTYDFDFIMPVSKRWGICLTSPQAMTNVRVGVRFKE